MLTLVRRCLFANLTDERKATAAQLINDDFMQSKHLKFLNGKSINNNNNTYYNKY